jgi:hypothetical protein
VSFDTLRQILEQIQQGQLDAQAALERLIAADSLNSGATGRTHATADAQVDLDRHRRCGYPEVIFSEGKTVEAVVSIFTALAGAGQECLATRVSAEQAAGVCERFPNAIHNAIARTIRLPTPASRLGRTEARPAVGKVAVITAGTSDRPVAEEAVETLRWMNCGVELIVDVGVAGPHRLLEKRDGFVDADAVVVVAGMEGALPSVVGGHVSCPVVAVPTSVGYGASFGGIAALLGMLNSCAANVTVVNIDAGFKGGYVAGLIAGRSRKVERSPDSST